MAKVIRKQYLIKKNLQISLIFEMAIFMFFVAVLVGWTIYLDFFKTLIFELSAEKLSLVNSVVFQRLAFRFIPTLIAIVILSVFLSHQIAGPVFVFQRTLRQLASDKKVRKVNLRKHDKLKDLADELNVLIEHHNRNVAKREANGDPDTR